MENLKKIIINKIIKVEGGFIDNPLDSGGVTKYGITESTAKMAGYKGEMADLSKDDAFNIYVNLYWNPLKLDAIGVYSWKIAEEIADTGVNTGLRFAGRTLQRCLNAFNNKGVLYPDLVSDGFIGDKTVGALRVYLNHREKDGEEVLMKAYNCLQGSFYIELSERREKDETFVYGWIRNRVDL